MKACDGDGFGSYHFSSGGDVSILELYDAVVKAMKLDKYPNPEIKELAADDVFSILLDPQKTFEDFGKIDFTPIEETVRQAVLYFDKYGTLGEYTHLKLNKE